VQLDRVQIYVGTQYITGDNLIVISFCVWYNLLMDAYQDPRENGKDISELGLNYKMPEQTIDRRMTHQILTDKILEVCKGEKQFAYGLWTKWITDSGGRLSMNDVLDIINKAGGLPDKYSKSGYIRNRLLGK